MKSIDTEMKEIKFSLLKNDDSDDLYDSVNSLDQLQESETESLNLPSTSSSSG